MRLLVGIALALSVSGCGLSQEPAAPEEYSPACAMLSRTELGEVFGGSATYDEDLDRSHQSITSAACTWRVVSEDGEDGFVHLDLLANLADQTELERTTAIQQRLDLGRAEQVYGLDHFAAWQYLDQRLEWFDWDYSYDLTVSGFSERSHTGTADDPALIRNATALARIVLENKQEALTGYVARQG